MTGFQMRLTAVTPGSNTQHRLNQSSRLVLHAPISVNSVKPAYNNKRAVWRKNMATVTFDTLDATRKLRDAGFDEKQAETVVRVLAEAQSNLVTKEHFDAKFDRLYWILGVLLAFAIANFSKQFF